MENIYDLSLESGASSKKKILACIVIPTYNEASNIKRLLDMVYGKENSSMFKEHNVLMEVLVVDDSSPDGTSSKVREYQKKNPRVHLLLRKGKGGLGAAYIAGMQHAMLTIRPDILLEMDADLSHDPRYIMPMIIEIINGADFVIGSRYVPGGSVPGDWGFSRKLISSAANAYARAALGIRGIRDCTGGFRAIRVSVLQKVNLNSLGAKGYVFQISLLNAVLASNAVVKEIPIDFRNRALGESKMGFSDIAEVGMAVLGMGLKKIFAREPAMDFDGPGYPDDRPAQAVIKM